MNLAQLLTMNSGDSVVAMRSSLVLDLEFALGTVGRIYVSENDDERHYFIRFTPSLRLDFSFFDLRAWDKLQRCGSCARKVPSSTLTTCRRCWRPDYCAACFGVHTANPSECTTPAVGPSRRPRRQRIISQLKEHHAKRSVSV